VRVSVGYAGDGDRREGCWRGTEEGLGETGIGEWVVPNIVFVGTGSGEVGDGGTIGLESGEGHKVADVTEEDRLSFASRILRTDRQRSEAVAKNRFASVGSYPSNRNKNRTFSQ